MSRRTDKGGCTKLGRRGKKMHERAHRWRSPLGAGALGTGALAIRTLAAGALAAGDLVTEALTRQVLAAL